MKITSLKAQNFLGAKTAALALQPITMIYAANGAGKSSLMDALRFAFDGEAVRDYTLSGLVHAGAKGAEVEVVFTGTDGKKHRIGRLLSGSGQSRFLDGTELKADEMAAEMARLTGVGAKTMAAALRAGALLKLPPADLQKLLLRLTGAKIDAAAIAAAFDADVTASAQRAELHLPTVLEEFEQCCKSAETARQEAKRAVKAATADVEHAPAAAAAGDRAPLVAARDAAQVAHTAAVAANAGATGLAAGAREERLRALRARQAELRAVEKPKSTRGEAKRAHADALLARRDAAGRREDLQQQLTVARLDLDAARAVAPVGPTEGQTTGEDPAAVQRELDAARVALTRLEMEGKAAHDRLESANVPGCSHTCPRHCVDVAKDTEVYAKSKTAYVEQRRSVKAVQARLVESQRVAAVKAAQVAGIQAAATVAALEPRVAGLEQQLAGITDDGGAVERLAVLVAGHEAFAAAEAQLRQVAADIEAVMAAPEASAAVDVAPLAAAVERTRAAVEAFDAAAAAGAARAGAEARLKEAKQRVDDTDAVAVACGPRGGARVRLFATALAPFVAAANEAITIVMDGFTMVMEADGELAFALSRDGHRFPHTAISEGESAVFEYALQYAVARLSGLGLLILDHAENVDEGRRLALKRLIGHSLKQDWQVVLLSCTAPPAKAPRGCACYSVSNGVATEIPA